jgi:hypothetical protein
MQMLQGSEQKQMNLLLHYRRKKLILEICLFGDNAMMTPLHRRLQML